MFNPLQSSCGKSTDGNLFWTILRPELAFRLYHLDCKALITGLTAVVAQHSNRGRRLRRKFVRDLNAKGATMGDNRRGSLWRSVETDTPNCSAIVFLKFLGCSTGF
jgi:hypothetical protein